MYMRKALLSTLAIISMAAWGSLLPQASARAIPQDQSTSSVADAARKAREQKKAPNPSTKVYTNDDLSKLKGPISIVGTEPEAAKPADTAPPTTGPAPKDGDGKGPVKDEGYWRAQFVDARRTLAGDAKELDVLQREFNLKQEQYYSNPDVALREQYSRKDLDDTQAQIDAKKQAVDKDNQAISDLEDAMHQAGGDPGWEREP